LKTVIVDTNILFSALLGKSNTFRDILLTEKNITFYSCKFELDGLLWTGDKTLREGLAAKGFDSFFDIE